jgi:hypothetical protein
MFTITPRPQSKRGSIINVGVTKEENKKKRKIREHTQKPNP